MTECKGTKALTTIGIKVLYVSNKNSFPACADSLCGPRGSPAVPFRSLFEAQDYWKSTTPTQYVTYICPDGSELLKKGESFTMSSRESLTGLTHRPKISGNLIMDTTNDDNGLDNTRISFLNFSRSGRFGLNHTNPGKIINLTIRSN